MTTYCDVAPGHPFHGPYHDTEYGFPLRGDAELFERLVLEINQAGLSWLTILRKRERFREVFLGFDFERLARFGSRDVERLLRDPGIVRHRGKIEATLSNARCACDLVDEAGSLSSFVWRFEPHPAERPRRITWAVLRHMAATPASTALSKELKRRGWRFVGPTTVYAFMQAMGLVNDHLDGCAVRPECDAGRRG